MVMGFDITAFAGETILLWDLISRKPPSVTPTGIFLIEYVFDWAESFEAAYDLEIEWSESNDHSPKIIGT